MQRTHSKYYLNCSHISWGYGIPVFGNKWVKFLFLGDHLKKSSHLFPFCVGPVPVCPRCIIYNLLRSIFEGKEKKRRESGTTGKNMVSTISPIVGLYHLAVAFGAFPVHSYE